MSSKRILNCGIYDKDGVLWAYFSLEDESYPAIVISETGDIRAAAHAIALKASSSEADRVRIEQVDGGPALSQVDMHSLEGFLQNGLGIDADCR